MGFVVQINSLYVTICFFNKISFFGLFLYKKLLLLVQELDTISEIQSVYVSSFSLSYALAQQSMSRLDRLIVEISNPHTDTKTHTHTHTHTPGRTLLNE